MRYTKTNQGNVVFLNNKYFFFFFLTCKLLEMYYEKKEVAEIAKELGIDEENVQGLYKKISDMILEDKSYNGEIQFRQPLKVQWKITNRCNIRCKHCYEGEKCQEQLDEEQIQDVFNKLLNSNILQLTITGGEALLVDNLANYIRQCLEKKIRVNVFTNAILLDKFIDDLGEVENKELLTFEVSVDGSQKQHDYIRGVGNYERTMGNIRYAIEKGYKIITNTVVNGITQKSIVPMMKELNSIGVSTIQLSNLMLKGWAKDNQNELFISKEELAKVYREISQTIDFDFYYADITNDVYHSTGVGKLQKEGKNTWSCCAGEARITIDFNGDVLICPLFPQYTLGNIKDSSLDEIWNNPCKQDYIKSLRDLNKNKQTCFVYDQNFAK